MMRPDDKEWLVRLRMWVCERLEDIQMRFNPETHVFVGPVCSSWGSVDEEATAKLQLQRYAVARLIRDYIHQATYVVN